MQSLETKSSKPRPKSFQTETSDIRDQDRDSKKQVSRHVSRPRPSLETPSLVPIVPKFEWNCFNYPNMIEAVGICPNLSTVIVCKFEWSVCILPNWNEAVWSSVKLNKAVWSSLKMNKAVWSYPKLNDVALGPCLNGSITTWPELI